MNKIYNVMPVFVQNLMISIYGLKIRRERFSSFYYRSLNIIDFYVPPSDNELKERVKGFLSGVVEDVPFYKASVSKDQLLMSKDLVDAVSCFPVVSKQEVRSTPDSFRASRLPRKIVKNHTSGSTGSPLEVFLSPESLEFNYAVFHRFLSEIGLNEFKRSATFAGRLIVPVEETKPPFWRTNWAMKTLLLSSYHISSRTFRDYIEALEGWAPEYIDSYPSAIYELALFLKEYNVATSLNLKAIVTSSETLFTYQRQLIEEVFRCPVFDYYGCAEQAVFACQLPSKSPFLYYVPAQYCLVEVLDESNNPVSPGHEGRLVCTNVFNNAMPLIRYDIGDTAVLSEYFEGTSFAKSLVCIQGRVDDVVVNSRGQRIGRLDPAFKGVSGIREAQVIQHSLTRLELKIVRSPGCSVDASQIIKSIKDRVGDDINVDVMYVEAIPRNSSGKFRSVVSNI